MSPVDSDDKFSLVALSFRRHATSLTCVGVPRYDGWLLGFNDVAIKRISCDTAGSANNKLVPDGLREGFQNHQYFSCMHGELEMVFASAWKGFLIT
jgi:hypothetical protein